MGALHAATVEESAADSGPWAEQRACAWVAQPRWQAVWRALAPCRWGELDLVGSPAGTPAAGGGQGRRRCGAELGVAALVSRNASPAVPRLGLAGWRPIHNSATRSPRKWCSPLVPPATGARRRALRWRARIIMVRERPGGTLEVLPRRLSMTSRPTEPASASAQHWLNDAGRAAPQSWPPPTCQPGESGAGGGARPRRH